MVTLVGVERDPISMLNDLISLDFDAVQAYEAAIARIDAPDLKAQLGEFRDDHRRHADEFAAVVRELGGAPVTTAGIKSLLTKGKVVIADLAGDRAVLLAMKTNEDDTNTAYERAVAREDLPAGSHSPLQQALADERRHRAWIEQQIAALG
jgi:uncharacterized protein (TIGR02284 family)